MKGFFFQSIPPLLLHSALQYFQQRDLQRPEIDKEETYNRGTVEVFGNDGAHFEDGRGFTSTFIAVFLQRANASAFTEATIQSDSRMLLPQSTKGFKSVVLPSGLNTSAEEVWSVGDLDTCTTWTEEACCRFPQTALLPPKPSNRPFYQVSKSRSSVPPLRIAK